jgi:multidrug efflux system outer membrane protein
MNAHPSHKSVAAAALAVLLPASLMAGCATGPDYKKPEVTPPAQVRFQVSQAEAGSIADTPLWNVFNDDALRSL